MTCRWHLTLFIQEYLCGPRGVRQILINLQSGRLPIFIFIPGLVVFLFLNCLNLHVSVFRSARQRIADVSPIQKEWRVQQTCPLTIYFNMSTESSDVSTQRRLRQPLSVHLWAYCTHPSHDVNDLMSEGWPQHRGLRPLLFSNSSVGSFTSHKNRSVKVLWDGTYGFSSLSEKTRKSNRLQMSLQRLHFLLSYLKTLSVGPAEVWTRDLPLSRPALAQLSQPGGDKTCFAVSVDCKLVIREAILPSHKPNTPPLKTSH